MLNPTAGGKPTKCDAPRESAYDRAPVVEVSAFQDGCWEGMNQVLSALPSAQGSEAGTWVIECYPGVVTSALEEALCQMHPTALLLSSEEAFFDPPELRERFADSLGSDPVFGYMQPPSIDAYLDGSKVERMRERIAAHGGLTLIVGPGASRIALERQALVYVSTTRWELQARQRAGQIGNLGLRNAGASPSILYKNAFFLDWRVGDRLRHDLFGEIQWFIDLDDPDTPRMVRGGSLQQALQEVVHRPFRLVPFFDPGPWGGQWMREKFGLPEGPQNYAWGFDCVPEENSILLGSATFRLSIPAQLLVDEQAEPLLGEAVFREFGREFPIRFDFLDTVEGGNLSLQVHPLKAYIREHFGMSYTQDESYYMFECRPGSYMYLGLREEVDRAAFSRALEEANAGGKPLEAADWVNELPTKRHDHFSIPAGTIHCSGRDNVVLEISATPYIFTFKLWDWGRLGLDGKPRPVHLQHGLANIQWERDTHWVEQELGQPAITVAEGDGFREERTGLHALEFLETRRHWFTRAIAHDTCNNVHVLNLVAGDAVVVESPEGKFPPLTVHYGETFIVPAAVGPYVIRPMHAVTEALATIKAYVRPQQPVTNQQ